MAKVTHETLARLREKKEQLETRLKRLRHQQRCQNRKADARRKFIVGGAVEAAVTGGDMEPELLERVLNQYVGFDKYLDTQKPVFYITVGDDDTLTPYPLSVRLHQALVEAGAQAQLRVTNGSHAWPVWRGALDDTLIFFSRAFESSF